MVNEELMENREPIDVEEPVTDNLQESDECEEVNAPQEPAYPNCRRCPKRIRRPPDWYY